MGLLGPSRVTILVLTAPNDSERSAVTDGHAPSVAIGHDSRHGSVEFSQRAASVLAANGIHAYLYPRLEVVSRKLV